MCLVFYLGFHIFFIPKQLFHDSTSTILMDNNHNLLSARIAQDGQWRFPETDNLNQRFVSCLINYEDCRFYHHIGIDPISIIRAITTNIKFKSIKEGGSTLTMQLARMARGNQPRTIKNKIIEALWTIDIESSYSKEDILRMYISHAPFGGNIVGIDAATWRYFNRDISCLSWAEAATLAVLPNSPALIHLGRNRTLLKQKRDHLLKILHEKNVITKEEYDLSLTETLPEKPYKIPNDAPHLIDFLSNEHKGESINTYIDSRLQHQFQNLANNYCKQYSRSNYIENIAIMVLDIETGEPIAYIGNTTNPESEAIQVDMIQSERSPGSTLKPFLYAAMLSSGEITPKQLIADTPLSINGFSPTNFSHSYSGSVPADDAIIQSLNVPLVRMLSTHTTARFMEDLKWLGITTLHYDEDHYGASIILGGAEVKLWDLCHMYQKLAYRYIHQEEDKQDTRITLPAIWYMFEAMSRLNRPEEEAQWSQFKSMKNIAWKTGTSWGSRDAWSIGITPKYVVGVWIGNATGEGRAGMTGVGYAAPVMFDVFSMLDNTNWFTPCTKGMELMKICKHSGCVASNICKDTETQWTISSAKHTETCPYCKYIHLTNDEKWRVNASCVETSQMKTVSRFVLPAAQEYYYKMKHINYHPLPPFKEGCSGSSNDQVDFIYPEHGSTIIIPKGFNGTPEKVVFKAVCRKTGSSLYWHIDNHYLGETQDDHQMSLAPDTGSHTLSIVDDEGNRKIIVFNVL